MGAGPSIVAKALSFVSGGSFEGEISMTMTPEGKPPHFIVYEMKGSKVRFDFGDTFGEVTYVIADYAAKTTALIDEKKMVVTLMSTEEAAAIDTALAKKKVSAAATGAKDVIAGYSCDVYQVTEENGEKDEACVAKGLRFPQMGANSNPWLTAMGGNDFFPMRGVRTDVAGRKTRMEVTKVDKKHLDDARFEIPAGYKTISMADLAGQLGPGAGRPRKM